MSFHFRQRNWGFFDSIPGMQRGMRRQKKQQPPQAPTQPLPPLRARAPVARTRGANARSAGERSSAAPICAPCRRNTFLRRETWPCSLAAGNSWDRNTFLRAEEHRSAGVRASACTSGEGADARSAAGDSERATTRTSGRGINARSPGERAAARTCGQGADARSASRGRQRGCAQCRLGTAPGQPWDSFPSLFFANSWRRGNIWDHTFPPKACTAVQGSSKPGAIEIYSQRPQRNL